MAEASPLTTSGNYKFPPLKTEEFPAYEEHRPGRRISSSSPSGLYSERANEGRSSDVWSARRSVSTNRWANANGNGTPVATRHGHGRQKSLSEAIRNIRERNGSMSHEIADALKAPVSWKLIVR